MILTKGQEQALKLFDSGENLLLLGGPGTGESNRMMIRWKKDRGSADENIRHGRARKIQGVPG